MIAQTTVASPADHRDAAETVVAQTACAPTTQAPTTGSLARMWEQYQAAQAALEGAPSEEGGDAAYGSLAVARDTILNAPCASAADAVVKVRLWKDFIRLGVIMDDTTCLDGVIDFLTLGTQSVRVDDELIDLGRQFEALEDRLGDTVAPTSAQIAAIVEEEDPLIQRAKQLRATTVEGLRAKALMADHHLPGADDLDSADLHIELARSIVDDVLAMSIPAEWSQVVTVRPNDPALAEVVRLAIAEGHNPGELAQACYHSHVPGFAPALYFEKANGDVVRVGQEGVLRILGRHRDGPDPERGQWLCLAERLAEACALGTRIDNQEDVTAEEVNAWSKIDDEVTDDILNLPARSVTGLKVKAKMAVACYGASATPDELNLADEKTVDVLLAEQIVRTLATM